MRLGTSIPSDENVWVNGKFSMDKALECLRTMSIQGCLHNLVQDEDRWESAAHEFDRSLRNAGVTLLEYNTPFLIYTPTISDCEITADKIIRCLAIAEGIGCFNVATCVGGPRSILPHEWNRSQECRDMLIRTCSIVAEKAARLGLKARLLLEPVYTTIIRTPTELNEIIDHVGSPNVMAHMDLVNLLSYDNIFDHTSFIHDAFRQFGGRIRSAHVKDALPNDSYLPGIHELPAGDGIVDLSTYISCLNELPPDFPVLIEHLSTSEDIKRCYNHILSLAEKLGITTWYE